MSMLTIVPSRGRPQAVEALAQQFRRTSTLHHSKMMFVFDDDDPALTANKAALTDFKGSSWIGWSVFPRLRMAGSLNLAAKSAVDSGAYRVIGFMGDDHRPRTEGWDTLMYEHAKDSIVYGNDLFQRQNLPTAVWMPERIVSIIGGMVPTGFIHLYLDNVWKLWGERLGRLKYLPNVIIEHMHPAAGKGQFDTSYGETGAPEVWENDAKRFGEYVQDELESDLAKMRTVL